MNIQNELTIRTATRDDRDIIYHMICGLEAQLLDPIGFNTAFEKNISNPGITYLIAFTGDIPVGIVSCHIQPLLHHAALVAEIQEMFVEPEYRSQQIGKALMEKVTEHAKNNGAIQMEVTSRATRQQAHQFYQREGFEKSHVKLVRYYQKGQQ